MSESIIDELLSENALLRQKLSEESTSYMFYLLSESPLKISGVLISEGVWKGVLYSYNELLKALPRFEDLKGQVMHGKTDEFKDKVIGQLTKVGKDDMLKAITFEAEVRDPEAVKKIKDKIFDAVSIKGGFKELDTSVTPPIGKDYSPIEWSLTGSPACSNCIIFNVEELSKNTSPNTKIIKEKESITPLGELNMTDINPEEIEITENMVLVLPDNFDSLEDYAEFEFKIVPESEFMELAKKTEGYYGYYPHTGKKSKNVLKGRKVKGKGYPKYPSYGYYPAGKGKKGLSEEDIVTIFENVGIPSGWMKSCMKEEGMNFGKCAKKYWGEKKGKKEEASLEEEEEEEEEEFEEEPELAEVKCPACDWAGKNLEEFKKHWLKEHKDKYGKYKYAKKLAKDIITKKELKASFKKVLALTEEEVPPTPTPSPETPPELTLKEKLANVKREPKTAAELLLETCKEETIA